jgi:uncharacterized protein (DUF305 family)
MNITARLGALIGAAVLSLTLAGCGGTTSVGSGSAAGRSTSFSTSVSAEAGHNAADVSFAQNMIVHHRGAIEMARLAATRASSQKVKDLAARIEAAQTPEITELTSWLAAWGGPTAPSETSMPGMDHSSGSMGSGEMSSGGAIGMMTDAQMSELRSASGPTFDRMFLQLMTIHHKGAIAMAGTERADGSNPQAVALALAIATSQTAQVTEMSAIRQSL